MLNEKKKVEIPKATKECIEEEKEPFPNKKN
jgi:hypothetical protein